LRSVEVLIELCNELEIGDYKIKLNHQKLLDGMLKTCGVPHEKNSKPFAKVLTN
jgi:histidyl-tRNA synthetase